MQEFGRNIWLVDGPTVQGAMGFHFPTRMAVIRLQDGGLFVWSPVGLTPDIQAWINGLGRVVHIVAPNSLHHTFLPDWSGAYPTATLHGAPGVAQKYPDLPISSDLNGPGYPGWARQIDQVTLPGNRITTEIVFFHRASGTALFTDLLQNYPKGWFTGWRGLVARLDLMTGPLPAVPRKFRVSFRDKSAVRLAVAQILDWPVQRVVMAHGTPVTQDARTYLRIAFEWLGQG